MNVNGEGMLSKNWSTKKYLELELSMESSDDKWSGAIELIRERFMERYFEVIHQLKWSPDSNGFAIMAMNCLLIDTFYQFENGDEETRNNKVRYMRFLRTYLGDLFPDDNSAKVFYEQIRCGILHSAQTKCGSQLTFGKEYTVKFINNDTSVMVDVVNFSERLEVYFEQYIMRLMQREKQTMKMFLRKMQFICRR